MNKILICLVICFIFKDNCFAQGNTQSTLAPFQKEDLELDSDTDLQEEVLPSVPSDEINKNSEFNSEKSGIFDFLFGVAKNEDGRLLLNDEDGVKPAHILVERFNDGSFYPASSIQIIDRTIGKVYNFVIAIGKTQIFNDLEIKPLSCWQPTKNIITPQSRGLFVIKSTLPNEDDTSTKMKPLFKGWLIASNPAASYVKHSKFDISLRKCEGVKEAVQNEPAK